MRMPSERVLVPIKRKPSHPWVRGLFVELALPLVIFVVVLWATADSKNFYFPPLGVVIERFDAIWLGPRLYSDVLPSLQRLAAGFGMACAVGIGLGLPIGMFETLRRAAEPVMEFFRAIPPPALVPIFVIVAGFGDQMKIAVIVVGSIWPILLNTVEGVRGADSVLAETCLTYQIRGWSRLRHFVLPGASPQIIVGMRIGLSIAIILMVISEMFVATNGLGAAIIKFQRSFEIPEMWSGVLMLGVIGFSLSIGFRLFERWALSWYHGVKNLERKQ